MTLRVKLSCKVSSAVTNYQSTNRSEQPVNGSDLKGYLDGKDPLNNDKGTNNEMAASSSDTLIDSEYIVKVSSFDTTDGIGDADTNIVQIITGAKCEGKGTTAGSSRNAAIMVVMENGLNKEQLSNSVMCQDV